MEERIGKPAQDLGLLSGPVMERLLLDLLKGRLPPSQLIAIASILREKSIYHENQALTLGIAANKLQERAEKILKVTNGHDPGSAERIQSILDLPPDNEKSG